MIQINLSEKQAKSLLKSLGWRWCDDSSIHDNVTIESDVSKEIFSQLEHALYPAPTCAAELATFKHHSGQRERSVEDWNRKNESMESAFVSYVKSVAKHVAEKYK